MDSVSLLFGMYITYCLFPVSCEMEKDNDSGTGNRIFESPFRILGRKELSCEMGSTSPNWQVVRIGPMLHRVPNTISQSIRGCVGKMPLERVCLLFYIERVERERVSSCESRRKR